MELLTIAALIAATGLIIFLRGLSQLVKRKPLRGSLVVMSGTSVALLGALLLSAGLNLASYERLTHERELIELTFYKVAPQHYTVSLRNLDNNQQYELDLEGDEWQIDARILKWHGYANLLGLDAGYKLERISGRYQDTAQARNAPPSLHPLSNEPGLDLWSLARRYSWLNPLIDASYGNATYMPMADGASYRVSVTQSGLIARSSNEAAKAALQAWQ